MEKCNSFCLLATHFSAARFALNQATAEMWRKVHSMCNVTCVRPLDYLQVDHGTNYISNYMKIFAQESVISIVEVPIEYPGTMGTVYLYHSPLQAAYEKLRSDLDRSDNRNYDYLQLAVHSINSTTVT